MTLFTSLILSLAFAAPLSHDQPWQPFAGGAQLQSGGLRARAGAGGLWLQGGREGGIGLAFVGAGRGDWQAVSDVQPRLGACSLDGETLDSGDCLRQLEYAHSPRLRSWWAPVQGGLQQGWTLEAPPPGRGALVLATSVSGALSIEVVGDGAMIVDEAGEAWTVDGLAAWDARGRSLPLRLRAEGELLIVEVQVEGAVWPVTVDPIYSPATRTWEGADVEDMLGTLATGVGDLNGDGYGDIAISSPGQDGATGLVEIYLGSAGGISSSPEFSYSGSSGSYFGGGVVGADLNGDGYGDLAIAQPGANAHAGGFRVYFGSAAGPSSTPDYSYDGPTPGGIVGVGLSTAGDFNGDGYDDLIVGYLTGLGILLGGPDGVEVPSHRPDISMTPHSSSDGGRYTCHAGDVNGDGYDDVMVGSPSYSSGTGASRIYYGAATAIEVEAWGMAGPVAGGSFGAFCGGLGDVNSDGFDDVAVSAWNADSGAGRVDLFLGSAAGLVYPAHQTWTGAAGAMLSRMAGLGDVNGDGHPDIALGACEDPGPGRVQIYLGASGGLGSAPDQELEGATDGAYYCAPRSAGDTDGDGRPELLVADPAWSEARGRVELLRSVVDADGDGLTDDVDCDDGDASAFPGHEELCDSIDNDCDGVVDGPDSVDAKAWQLDSDGDGYTDPEAEVIECSAPGGFLAPSASPDCDDSEASVHPGATEVEGDGVDQDCDGEDLAASGDGGGDGADGGGGGADGSADGGGSSFDGGEGADGGASDGDGGKGGCSTTGGLGGLSWLAGLIGLLGLGRRR